MKEKHLKKGLPAGKRENSHDFDDTELDDLQDNWYKSSRSPKIMANR